MELELERLKPEHLPAVLEIEQVSFPGPWTKAMFEREISLPISHFYVGKLENKIVSYGGYWQIEDEAHLINLAVHPEYRGKGLGRRFLRFLTGEIENRGLAKVLLEVRKSNHEAQRLYAAEGFSTVGLRPKYYQNEDAILMEKILVKIHEK